MSVSPTCLARRLLALASMFFILSGANGVTSRIASASVTDVPFSVGLQGAVGRLLTGVTDGSCYPYKGGIIPLAFVGIPPNNVHFTQTERVSLNQRTRRVLQGFSFFWKVLNTQTFQTIAAQTGLNPGDRQQLLKAVEEIKGTPLVFIISAERPAKAVAKLKLELFARTAEGVQVCPKAETLFVDIARNTIVPIDRVIELETETPIVKRRWAFTHALRSVADTLRDFETVALEIDYRMSGNCRLRNTSEVAFRANYSDVEQEMVSKFALSRGEWPALRVDTLDGARRKTPTSADASAASNASPKTATLRLQFSLDREDPELVDLALQVNAGARDLASRFMRVHVRPGALRGCTELSNNILDVLVRETRGLEASFRLRPSKAQFLANRDPVSVIIEPREDRYFYCWVLDAQGTAYVLLPLSKSQGLKPWKANSRIVYPDDFRDETLDQFVSQAVVYPEPARELVGCFASPARLAPEIEARWLDLHIHNDGGGGPNGEVPSEDVQDWLRTMRAVPGIEERYTWIEAIAG